MITGVYHHAWQYSVLCFDLVSFNMIDVRCHLISQIFLFHCVCLYFTLNGDTLDPCHVDGVNQC